MLRLEAVDARYGDVQVLHGVELEVKEGEIAVVVGANGAGKTTTLNVISGLLPCSRGAIHFQGRPIEKVPAHRRVEMGLVQVPEGRRLFPFMTVRENLELGCYTREARAEKDKTLRHVFELLPVLEERQRQLAGTLSGGEQQMAAIGRGLMAKPKLLMLDEPTLGLGPMVVVQVFETIKEINARGTTVLLVEQNVRHSLNLAHRGYVFENGRVVLEGTGQSLLADERLKRAYLGM